jgi:radical SAM enzyme (TIGR01210 family)
VIATAYPANPAERTRWIIERRSPPTQVSAEVPYAFLSEEERMESGEVARVSTIFLTNRECPWKCLMCDLWRNTTPAPPGSIPRQIEHALSKLPSASVLKLYNSGSFFDRHAVPRSDWIDIARLCRPFNHLILECHPKLIGPGIIEFDALFSGQLEIAMGLETAHPLALEKLNKRITVDDFTHAAHVLRQNQIAVRTFLLISVPFIPQSEQQHWIERSINTAFDSGTNVVSLIPTRTGNGALDSLQLTGDFREPTLSELEHAHEYGLRLQRGRVFADTWDLARFSSCPRCATARVERLHGMNLSQSLGPRIRCFCEN